MTRGYRESARSRLSLPLSSSRYYIILYHTRKIMGSGGGREIIDENMSHPSRELTREKDVYSVKSIFFFFS